MSLIYRFELIVSSNNIGIIIRVAAVTHYTSIFDSEGAPQNSSPTRTILSNDIPTQMEPRVISKKCKFWVKNTRHVYQLPTETSYKKYVPS